MDALLRRREMMAVGTPGPIVIPYQEIEYIQSTGVQYIDLDYKASSATCVEVDILWPYQPNREIIGARNNTSKMFEFLYSDNGLYFQYGSSSPFYSNFTSSQRNVFSNQQNIFYINGTQVMSATASTFSTTVNLTLFALNNNGTIQREASAKLYSLKIMEGSSVKRDMVPVRDGQIGYLYDKVSRSLFGNSGSGSFTLGPDIIEN